MNRPCLIHFHDDAAPLANQLPERYQDNIYEKGGGGVIDYTVRSLLVQNAFPIDFAPEIIRTRVGGTKEEDPVDFPLASISFIEWFYGDDVPSPLVPWEDPKTKTSNGRRN